jgi:hypothetical protein
MANKSIRFFDSKGDPLYVRGEQMPDDTYALSMAADDGLKAARDGRGRCAKVNAKTGINAASAVLTDTGFLIPLTTGQAVVIPCFYVHLNTPSDWLDFELVYTAEANGTGAVVAMSPKMRIETGAANSNEAPTITNFNPPAYVKYSATSKAVSMRVQTNDTAASATIGLNYWTEDA